MLRFFILEICFLEFGQMGAGGVFESFLENAQLSYQHP
jgi:hypothetical protein